MKRINRILAIIICLALILPMLPTSVFAVDDNDAAIKSTTGTSRSAYRRKTAVST